MSFFVIIKMVSKMNKRKLAIMLNLLLIVLEINGLIISFSMLGLSSMIYYTQDSNILGLISSIIVLYYLAKNKEFTKFVSVFRFLSIVSLTITFLVVLLVLAPMSNFDLYFLFVKDASMYVHLICPLMGIISFIFFEKHDLIIRKDNVRSLYFTFVYAFITIVLNIIGVLEGPYPFLLVKQNSLLISLFWFVFILGGSYLISYSLLKVKGKVK